MNNQSWQSTQNPLGWSNIYQPPFNTNIIYVTSPEEALMKTNQRNCEAVYFHQDKPIFYRVKVDADGRKMWQSFNYGPPNPDLTTPATKAELVEIVERLQRLESRFTIPATEVNTDGESNG